MDKGLELVFGECRLGWQWLISQGGLSAWKPLLKGWGFPVFGSSLHFWNPALIRLDYSHQVQELVALSWCRFPLLINYLTCLLNLYTQWREAYFHMSIWKYFTCMEPSIWFSKKRFEKQFSPVCLGRDQGLSTCLVSRKAVSLNASWLVSEGNGCGILNWLTGLFAEWETLSCGNVKGISFSGMFLLCFHPTLPVL